MVQKLRQFGAVDVAAVLPTVALCCDWFGGRKVDDDVNGFGFGNGSDDGGTNEVVVGAKWVDRAVVEAGN